MNIQIKYNDETGNTELWVDGKLDLTLEPSHISYGDDKIVEKMLMHVYEKGKNERGIPDSALCFFDNGRDGWACAKGDFISQTESPIGFGSSFDRALIDFQKECDRCKAAYVSR